PRRNSWTPAADSSAATCFDTADCVNPSRSDAPVNEPVSITARSVRRSWGWTSRLTADPQEHLARTVDTDPSCPSGMSDVLNSRWWHVRSSRTMEPIERRSTHEQGVVHHRDLERLRPTLGRGGPRAWRPG